MIINKEVQVQRYLLQLVQNCLFSRKKENPGMLTLDGILEITYFSPWFLQMRKTGVLRAKATCGVTQLVCSKAGTRLPSLLFPRQLFFPHHVLVTCASSKMHHKVASS